MKNLVKMLGMAAVCGGLMTGVASSARADTVILQDQDRIMVRDWFINNHGCPPGTVMHEKQRYMGLVHPYHTCEPIKGANVTVFSPGTVIPSTVTYTELPRTVVEKLPAPPSGDVYVTTDTGTYLINPQTRTVVDSVSVIDND
jgi:hypothetical protein